jgi:hypothetical protein
MYHPHKMDSRPTSPWRRIGEILRWRGLRVLFLLGVRNILRPIVDWHEYARGRAVSVALASISTMNAQSLSLANHYNCPVAMTVTLIEVRPLKWRIHRASGASGAPSPRVSSPRLSCA